MSTDNLKIYSDGGARGNPGPSAAAFVVIKNGRVVFSQSKFLGENTNNFAEYSGVFMAIKWLSKNRNKKEDGVVTVHVDSQLVSNQLSGNYKVKSKNLMPLFLKIRKLESKFITKFIYRSVPRDKNKLADHLVNEVLDEKS